MVPKTSVIVTTGRGGGALLAFSEVRPRNGAKLQFTGKLSHNDFPAPKLNSVMTEKH